MTHRIITAIAATIIAGAVPAHAQGFFDTEPADSGFYISAFLGAGSQGDVDYNGIQNPAAGAPGVAGAPANVSVEFDTDTFFGGAIGYQLPFTYWNVFHPRLELEVSSISGSDVSDGSFNGGQQQFGGDQEILFVLLNNYSDIRWSDTQTIVPFVGGGLGIGQVDADIRYAGGGAVSPNFAVLGDDSGLAGTIAAGLTYEASDQFEVYSEARYYRIEGIELDRRFIAGGADAFNAAVEDDLDGVTWTAGIRARF